MRICTQLGEPACFLSGPCAMPIKSAGRNIRAVFGDSAARAYFADFGSRLFL